MKPTSIARALTSAEPVCVGALSVSSKANVVCVDDSVLFESKNEMGVCLAGEPHRERRDHHVRSTTEVRPESFDA
jgi:hypothetical protein